MILLELTSQHNQKRVFIVTDTITVYDIAGSKIWGVEGRVERGCVIDDGKHNNGGWKVEETYDQVVAMIKEQMK
jgi:hypothetical protein